jgi:hypothetical protein
MAGCACDCVASCANDVRERDAVQRSPTAGYTLGEYLEGPVAKSVLPASKLGGAFNYIRNHWEALNVFVNDGALPIDNNQVERLVVSGRLKGARRGRFQKGPVGQG